MPDLHTRLDEIAVPTVAPSTSTVDADLARGRRALRLRRTVQIAGGSSLAVAAVLVAALAIPHASAARNSAKVAGGGTTIGTNGASGTHRATRLVAYTGQQPNGYTLDQMPEGWVVQGSNEYHFTLAPENAADKNPDSFAGKIVIDLSDAIPNDVVKKDILVGDQPGVLATMAGPTGGRSLFVQQPSGAYLTIQVWDGLGWSDGEIVQFALGVHVHDDAVVAHG